MSTSCRRWSDHRSSRARSPETRAVPCGVWMTPVRGRTYAPVDSTHIAAAFPILSRPAGESDDAAAETSLLETSSSSSSPASSSRPPVCSGDDSAAAAGATPTLDIHSTAAPIIFCSGFGSSSSAGGGASAASSSRSACAPVASIHVSAAPIILVRASFDGETPPSSSCRRCSFVVTEKRSVTSGLVSRGPALGVACGVR